VIFAVVGCGNRGAIAAALLAGAGVAELSLVDGAFVGEGDLGRHPLQFKPDLHASRAEALAAKIGLLNSDVHAQPFPAFLDQENGQAILIGADCVLDCCGDSETSTAIAAAAEDLGIPVIAPPEDYDSSAVAEARACALGALQAELALEIVAQPDGEGSQAIVRVDTL
jgi:molybdopterin/thiamine biosynthesis adenylyltransferase